MLAVEIVEQCPALVVNSSAYCIDTGRSQHHISGNVDDVNWNLHLFLIIIVERQDEPENGRKQNKEQEGQELLVQITQQEVLDDLNQITPFHALYAYSLT